MKVGICSLGCRVNIYESEFVENLLINHNYKIVNFNESADIYIILFSLKNKLSIHIISQLYAAEKPHNA